MKKAYLFIFLLTFIIPIISHSQSTDIFIATIETDRNEYNKYGTIYGEFRIDNGGNTSQSDLTIVTSIEIEVGSSTIAVESIKQQNDLYLKNLTRNDISFEHKLSTDFAGEAKIVVIAYAKEGIEIGRNEKQIIINGEQDKPFIFFNNAYIDLNEEKFPLQVGPTVTPKSEMILTVKTESFDKVIPVKPTLTLYNRSRDSVPLKTIELENLNLEGDTLYSFVIPTDLEPLVYEARLSFKSSDFQVQDIFFRYIIEGKIGTILNLNTDSLNGKKRDEINVIIEYGGTPIPFNLKTQVTDSPANIEIEIFNEDNVLVGNSSVEINLNKSNTISVPIKLKKDANSFVLKGKLKTPDGKILSEYNTTLPSGEESLKRDKNFNFYIMLALLGIILVIVLIFINKIRHKIPIVVLVFGFLLGYLFVLNDSNAFTVDYLRLGPNTDEIRITSMISPKPSFSYAYNPGEAFRISVNAVFTACNNYPWNFRLYGPSDNFATFNPIPLSTSISSYKYVDSPELKKWWTDKGGSLVYTFNGGGAMQDGTTAQNGLLVNPPKLYYAPTTPGVYNFYIMIIHENYSEVSASIVHQEICVRGAGKCFGEESFLLGVTKNGDGNGLVSSNPSGINCGSNCSASYLKDTVVNLTASPLQGSTFTGWSGACSGANTTCTVTMDTLKNVVATFKLSPSTYTVTYNGNGQNLDSPTMSPSACTETTVGDGCDIILTANKFEKTNYTFKGWKNSATDLLVTYSNSAVINGLKENKTLYAHWEANQIVNPDLDVSLLGNGTGVVVSNDLPKSINCGGTPSDCTGSYTSGTSITLTANIIGNSTFDGWGGDCSGSPSNTCVLNMLADKSVTATFTKVGTSDIPPDIKLSIQPKIAPQCIAKLVKLNGVQTSLTGTEICDLTKTGFSHRFESINPNTKKLIDAGLYTLTCRASSTAVNTKITTDVCVSNPTTIER